MSVLEMRDATFVRGGDCIVAPLSVILDERERVARRLATAREAATVALMAAGIVKATAGRVFIGEFDPRIQPVQVKRVVGYVPHEAVHHEFASFSEYIGYRAALWGLPRNAAIVHANELLEELEGVHEAFAYPLVGALIARPSLLVLDRPQSVYAPQIIAVAGEAAIFSTHVSERETARFQAGCDQEAVPV
ncbi:MAG: hypothetical protein ACXWNK_14555 [Vulcanimicrobiaceae bacterium]